MKVQNFNDYQMVQSGDLNAIPLNFYSDFGDFFKQIASTTGTLKNGVIGSTSFVSVVSGSNISINPGVCIASFNNVSPNSDFPSFCIGSNLNSSATLVPLSNGTLVATLVYSTVSGNRSIYSPTNPAPVTSSVNIQRYLQVQFSITTAALTAYQIPLYTVSGTTLTDIRNILFSGQSVNGDGTTTSVTSNTVSVKLSPNKGIILDGINGIKIDSGIALTTDATSQTKTGNLTLNGNVIIGGNIDFNGTTNTSTNNIGCNAVLPISNNHLTRKDYVDARSPAGIVNAFAGLDTAVPNGWLLCDGSQVLQTDYPKLYSVIGNIYGTGSSGYFVLPDYRAMFLRGTNLTRSDSFKDPDITSRTGGNNVGSTQLDQIVAHAHAYTAPSGYRDNQFSGGSVQFFNTPVSGSTTTTGGNETRPNNINVNYIISTGKF